jgi:hypothetical protein
LDVIWQRLGIWTAFAKSSRPGLEARQIQPQIKVGNRKTSLNWKTKLKPK